MSTYTLTLGNVRIVATREHRVGGGHDPVSMVTWAGTVTCGGSMRTFRVMEVWGNVTGQLGCEEFDDAWERENDQHSPLDALYEALEVSWQLDMVLDDRPEEPGRYYC